MVLSDFSLFLCAASTSYGLSYFISLRNAIMLSLSSLSFIALLAFWQLAIFVSIHLEYLIFVLQESLFLNLEEHINLPDK